MLRDDRVLTLLLSVDVATKIEVCLNSAICSFISLYSDKVTTIQGIYFNKYTV